MDVYCCQFDIVWEDKGANHGRVGALLERAGVRARGLVLLPEMFATGFSMNVGGIDDSGTGETRRFLSSVARRYGVYVVGGVVTAGPDGRGRNQAVVFSPAGEEVACYQKIHPFTFGGEAKHYAAGSEIVTFRWGAFTVCPFVCYDLRFPELFRLAVRRGADLFAVIANWPASREQHWLTLLAARAIENQAYVVGVNRCGRDNVLAYSGRSVIIDPRGEIVADAGNGEGVVHAAVDAEMLRNYREGFPALGDMRGEHFPE